MALQVGTEGAGAGSLARRLWQYQRERFPLATQGVAIAAFTLAALGVSVSASPRTTWPDAGTVLVALTSVFGFFLLLRIADEFKDRDEDARYRVHRPVPRGLVSLRELAGLGAVTAALQFAAALWQHPPLATLLLAVLAYFGLMSAEFFAPTWLRRRPVVYLFSHMAILPLIALYASACHWLTAGAAPDSGVLGAIALLAFGNGLVFELGRKVRAPGDEQPGIETYSGLWGPRTAALSWMATVILAVLGALGAGVSSGIPLAAAIVAPFVVIGATAVAAIYARAPTRSHARTLEISAQAIVLVLLLAVGLPPLGKVL